MYADMIDSIGFLKTYDSEVAAAMGDELRALNSFDNIAYNLALGAAGGYDYFETAPVLKDVTADEVRDFLKTWLTGERLSVSVVQRKE